MTRLTDEQLRSLEERYTPPDQQKCRVCGSALEFSSSGAGGSVYHCSGDEAGIVKNNLDSGRWKQALEHYNNSAWRDRSSADLGVVALIEEARRFLRDEKDRGDYRAEFEDFWRDAVTRDGVLNEDQIARELADYGWLQGAVAVTYDNVTGGRISKPFTLPSVVIQQADEYAADAVEDGVRDILRTLREAVVQIPGDGGGRQAVLDVIDERVKQYSGD